jgi:hypothetical protein
MKFSNNLYKILPFHWLKIRSISPNASISWQFGFALGFYRMFVATDYGSCVAKFELRRLNSRGAR